VGTPPAGDTLGHVSSYNIEVDAYGEQSYGGPKLQEMYGFCCRNIRWSCDEVLLKDVSSLQQQC